MSSFAITGEISAMATETTGIPRAAAVAAMSASCRGSVKCPTAATRARRKPPPVLKSTLTMIEEEATLEDGDAPGDSVAEGVEKDDGLEELLSVCDAVGVGEDVGETLPP